jgi:hypothetical protein
MKILKMPDKQTEQFDLFVQQQLNQVDIDVSRADEFAGSMQFPVSVEPAAKQSWWKTNFSGKRKYLSALILLVFLSGTTIILLNKFSTRSEKQENTAPINEGSSNTIQQDKDNTDNPQTNNRTNTNTGNAQQVRLTPGGGSNLTSSSATPDHTTKKTVTTGDGDVVSKDDNPGKSGNDDAGIKDAAPTPVNNMADNKLVAMPKTDSVATTPIEKKPPVKKDTIHVIW